MNEIEEIWKPIEGFEGYEVSSLGRVRSLDREKVSNNGNTRIYKGRLLSQRVSNNGYKMVMLSNAGKSKNCTVHRLVAKAFISNPQNLPQVNHINEFDKTDNRVENLEWMSAKDNCNYGTRNQRQVEKRLNNPQRSKQVHQYTLDGNLIKIWLSSRECDRNGFNQAAVSRCCLGKQKQHKGFKWKYEN